MTTLDGELLERARINDAQALAEIYDHYAGPIYRYLYRYLGDAGQAEDLTGEVFLKLLQVLNTPRAPREKLQGWLYRVAHNMAMDWFRRESRYPTVELDDGLVTDTDSPTLAMEKRQGQQHLRLAIARLTPDQQRVVLLRFGEGLKIAEVSRLIGKSEGAVKILQHRAIKRLRKLLEQKEKSSNARTGS